MMIKRSIPTKDLEKLALVGELLNSLLFASYDEITQQIDPQPSIDKLTSFTLTNALEEITTITTEDELAQLLSTHEKKINNIKKCITCTNSNEDSAKFIIREQVKTLKVLEIGVIQIIIDFLNQFDEIVDRLEKSGMSISTFLIHATMEILLAKCNKIDEKCSIEENKISEMLKSIEKKRKEIKQKYDSSDISLYKEFRNVHNEILEVDMLTLESIIHTSIGNTLKNILNELMIIEKT